MGVVSDKLQFKYASSLLLGGCLLSFFVGRWSSGGHESSTRSAAFSEAPLFTQTIEVPDAASSPTETIAVLSSAESEFDWEASQDRSFAAWIEKQKSSVSEIAKSDPQRAFALADTARFEPDRLALKIAALEGWSTIDASAALAAAMGLSSENVEAAVGAVLNGAASSPDAALSVMDSLRGRDEFSGPVLRRLKFTLVGALAREGFFEQAWDFAYSQEKTGEGVALMKAGLAQWSRYEPELAVSAAMDLEDRSAREEMYSVVTSTWSGVDPAGLAKFAARLPEGKERSQAMKSALVSWVSKAPLEAANWLDAREPAQELDVGVLALATHPFLAERSPKVAVSWAESLWDENLRADTVGIVVKQWAATDRRAAVAYVRDNPELDIAQRQELLALFGERKEFGIDGRLP